MRPALIVLALLLPLPAAAEALPPADHALEFRSMDVDGDGHISLSEAAGNGDIVTKFDRADRNRDGRLSQKEFDALKTGKLPKMVSKVPTTKMAMARMNSSAATGGSAEKKGGKKPAPEKKAAGG
jgi:Ca2+-binding EF-hand superfamily protein